ncbi:hypothetical protein SAMN05421505_11282 [Sinosporangium album]|uniref:Uncharacterized protein n=1 Tax=Sinosporangium album TaxID=504805 RepID=A0A1G8AAV0_9ACTN|nr:hypothetical protein SAMN05421505_11282 [Sinosporangium album]
MTSRREKNSDLGLFTGCLVLILAWALLVTVTGVLWRVFFI